MRQVTGWSRGVRPTSGIVAGVTTTPRPGWREFAAVVIGGMLGTALRLAIDLAFPHESAGFPWGTLAINVVGSFLLAALVSTLSALVCSSVTDPFQSIERVNYFRVGACENLQSFLSRMPPSLCLGRDDGALYSACGE